MHIEITENSGSTLTYYQVPITLNTTTFNYSKAKANGDDIRFATNGTECDYWIETWNATGESKLWVEVPSLPASGTTTIYMYYGNSGASAASDGDATFEFFDDATGTYSDKWTNIEGTGSYASVGGRQAISLGSATTNIRTSSYQSNGPIAIDADLYTTEVITAIQYYQDSTPATNEHYHARIDVRSGEKEAILEDSAFTGSEVDVFSSASTWVTCLLTRDQNGNHKWYVGGSLGDQRTNDTTYSSGYLALNHHNSGTGAVANLRVRKYASPEPTVNLGQEESSTSWMDYFGGTAAISASTDVAVSGGDVTLTTSNQTAFSDSFETDLTKWDGNGATDWYLATDLVHDGSQSVKADKDQEGYLTSDDIDLSDAIAASLDFWFMKDDTENDNDILLYFYDGSTYNLISDLDTLGGDDVWLHWDNVSIALETYGISNFRIRFWADLEHPLLGSEERVWVDQLVLTKTVYKTSGNLKSIAITPDNLHSWDKFYANHTLPTGTDITYKILNAADDSVLCTITAAQAAAGYDISSCAGATSSIKLYGQLSTTGSNTPTLHDWKVTWVTNTPPTVDAVALYQSDKITLISSGESMDPQVEYAVKVTVTDNNTLDDINEVKITIFYDSAGDDPAAPGTSNTQTCAIITWTKGSGWSIDPSAGTSWVLVTANCKTPTMSATTGDWWAHFKPGKVATQSGVADDWDIYAKATDAAATSAELYTRDYEMSWYGEVTVNTVEVDFGTVELGSDFSANEQTGISVTYIANGAYNQQVKASSPWGTAPNQVTLNASGNPGDGEFSLKANDTATLGEAVLVSSTAFTTFDTGTQTGESGNVESTNTVWLKLGAAGIAAVTYNGTIYYRITQ